MKNCAKTVNEILAPVGGREQLEAAVRCGADAVYFGTPDFNARRNAANFDGEAFLQAVKYCHERGVKAYITLNTLVTDEELPLLRETLFLIAKSGADAVIVQDFAVMRAVKRHCPTLRLHASTQMAVHNAAGARLLQKEGFSRIVLARELTLDEIKAIAAAVSCEIEVFVHGAHCISVSGMCYMSSALGARSGNRGLCAQPCRLNFNCRGREYALSLKDMCNLEHLKELSAAGVCSFKIEGRMKRPEYVAAAVTAAKKAINGYNPDLQTLKSVFSRSGFSDGYLTGKRTLDMFGIRTRDDVVAAADVLPSLKRLYKDERKSVKLEVSFTAYPEKPCTLTLCDGENTVCVNGDVPEAAQKMDLNVALCEKSLLKLGGTPYYADGVKCDLSPGIMLSAASLNLLRREAIEKLSAKRTSFSHEFIECDEKTTDIVKNTDAGLYLRFEKAEQIPENVRCDKLFLPIYELMQKKSLLEEYKGFVFPELPVLIYPQEEEKILQQLAFLYEKGVKYALCENIGAVGLAKQSGIIPLGGQMLSVLNSEAFAEYTEMGVGEITLSTEESFVNMRRMKVNGKFGIISYGHMPLMRFRCCPMQGKTGCADCSGVNRITDRRGDDFTVICSRRQYQTLYNAVPLYTGNMKMPAADFYTLYFTYEEKSVCAEVISCFNKRISVPFGKTAGLYDKELL